MTSMIRLLVCITTVSTLAACASAAPPQQLYQSTQYVQAQKQEEKGGDPSKIMICEQEMVTGSHIPTRHCWSKLEMDVARDRAQRAAQNQVRLDAPK